MSFYAYVGPEKGGLKPPKPPPVAAPVFHRHFSSRNEQRLANVLESGKMHATAGASRIKLAVSSSMKNEFWLQEGYAGDSAHIDWITSRVEPCM